jgi:hypothetical protein
MGSWKRKGVSGSTARRETPLTCHTPIRHRTACRRRTWAGPRRLRQPHLPLLAQAPSPHASRHIHPPSSCPWAAENAPTTTWPHGFLSHVVLLPIAISLIARLPLACLLPRSLVQWLSVSFPLVLFLLRFLDVVVQRPSLRRRLASSDPRLDLGLFPHTVC